MTFPPLVTLLRNTYTTNCLPLVCTRTRLSPREGGGAKPLALHGRPAIKARWQCVHRAPPLCASSPVFFFSYDILDAIWFSAAQYLVRSTSRTRGSKGEGGGSNLVLTCAAELPHGRGQLQFLCCWSLQLVHCFSLLQYSGRGSTTLCHFQCVKREYMSDDRRSGGREGE